MWDECVCWGRGGLCLQLWLTSKRQARATSEGKEHHRPSQWQVGELVQELQRLALKAVRGGAKLAQGERTGCDKDEIREAVVHEDVTGQPAHLLHLVPHRWPPTSKRGAG